MDSSDRISKEQYAPLEYSYKLSPYEESLQGTVMSGIEETSPSVYDKANVHIGLASKNLGNKHIWSVQPPDPENGSIENPAHALEAYPGDVRNENANKSVRPFDVLYKSIQEVMDRLNSLETKVSKLKAAENVSRKCTNCSEEIFLDCKKVSETFYKSKCQVFNEELDELLYTDHFGCIEVQDEHINSDCEENTGCKTLVARNDEEVDGFEWLSENSHSSDYPRSTSFSAKELGVSLEDEEDVTDKEYQYDFAHIIELIELSNLEMYLSEVYKGDNSSMYDEEEEQKLLTESAVKTKQSEPCGRNKLDDQDQLVAQTKRVLRQYDDSHKPKTKIDTNKEEMWNVVGETAQYKQKVALDEIMLTAAGQHDQLTVDNQSDKPKDHSGKSAYQLAELEKQSVCQELEDRSHKPAGQSKELEDTSHKPEGQSQEPEDTSHKPAGQSQEPKDMSDKTAGQSQELEDRSDKTAGQSHELEDMSDKTAGQSQELEDRSDKIAGQSQELEDMSDKPAGQSQELEDRSDKTAGQSQELEDMSDKPAGQSQELEDRSDKKAGQSHELQDMSDKTAGQSQELEDRSDKTAGQQQEHKDMSDKPTGQSQELEDRSDKPAGQSQEPEDRSDKTAGQPQELEDRSDKPAGQSQELEDRSDKTAGQSQELEDRSDKPAGQSQELEDRSDKQSEKSADHSCELVNKSEEYKDESGQLNNNIQKNKLKLEEDENKCKVEPVLQVQSELNSKGQFKQDLLQQKKAVTFKNNVIDMNADTTLSTKCVNSDKAILERIWAPLKAPIVAFWSHLCCISELLSTWLIKKKGLIAKAECQAPLSDVRDLTSEGELEHTNKQIDNAEKTVEKADSFKEPKPISLKFGHTQTFQDSDVATITNKDKACSDAKINQETYNKTGDAIEEPCNVIKGTIHPTRKRERMQHLKDESTKLNAKDLFEGKPKMRKKMSTISLRNAQIAKQVKSFFKNRADSLEHQQTDCLNRKDRCSQSLMNRKRCIHKKAPQYERNARRRQQGNARQRPILPRVPHPEMDNDALVPTQTPEDSGYLSELLTSMSSLSSMIQSIASSSAEPYQFLLKERLKAQEYDILHIISNWDYFRPPAGSLHVAPGLEDYFTSIENGENVSTEVEMSIEMLRIRSLSEYRGDGSRVNLAKNGFFFEPSPGPSGTRCVGCKCVYSDWKFFDDIPAIHRRLSPNCPYVTGLAPGNNDDVEPRSSSEASGTTTASIATRLTDAQRTADVIPSRTAEVTTNQSSNFMTSTSQGQNIAVTSMTGENLNSDLSPLAASSSEAVAVPKTCSALDELTSSLQQANIQAAEKTDQGGAARQPSEDAENDSLLRTTNLYGQQGLNVRNPLRVGRQNQSGPRRAPEEPSQPNNCPAILTERGLSDLAAKIGEEWIMFFLCLQMPFETIQEIIERHGDQASVNTIKACLKRWKDSNSDTDEKKVDLISNALNEIGRAELVAYLRQYNQDPQQSLGPNFIGAGPSASRTTVNVYEGTNEPRQVDIVNPRYPQYASVDVRISSYKGWPPALGLTARQMAEAGFFYAGVADFTRCFACGGGLRNWESGDDPCLEHTRWFPHCEYMKKLKGEVYVRNIKLRQQQHLERQKKEQEEEEARKNAAKKDPTAPVETDAGKILQGMGYTAERITSVIETLRRQTGKIEVSAEQALRYILDEDEGNTPVTGATPGRPPQASNQKVATGSLSSATGAKAAESLSTATAKSSDSQASSSGESASVQSKPHSHTQISSSSQSSSSRSPVRNEMQGSANGKSGKKKKKKKGKNEDKNANEATNLDPASLLEENERLKEMQKCKICMDKAVDTTLLPCGHLVLCSDCAIKVNLCPICRLKIMGTVRTFLS